MLIAMFLTFSANDKIVPAGANIVVPIYFMGHNSDLFPDAETFNPERSFKASTNDSVNHFAYIPFSAGQYLHNIVFYK